MHHIGETFHYRPLAAPLPFLVDLVVLAVDLDRPDLAHRVLLERDGEVEGAADERSGAAWTNSMISVNLSPRTCTAPRRGEELTLLDDGPDEPAAGDAVDELRPFGDLSVLLRSRRSSARPVSRPLRSGEAGRPPWRPPSGSRGRGRWPGRSTRQRTPSLAARKVLFMAGFLRGFRGDRSAIRRVALPSGAGKSRRSFRRSTVRRHSSRRWPFPCFASQVKDSALCRTGAIADCSGEGQPAFAAPWREPSADWA